MRCRYCFQAIPDRSTRCPECGSRLPKQKNELAAGVFGEETQKGNGGVGPLSAQQAAALVGGILLVLALLCGVVVALVSPGLLPQPVIDRLSFLATPTPLPTFQATRVSIAPSPTPHNMNEHCSRRGNFCIGFPDEWLVTDQGLPPWQREVEALGERYEWAPSLFVTTTVPTVPRIRAVPPALVDVPQGRVARFTVGESDWLEDGSFEEIERLARQEPEALAPPEDVIVPNTFAVQRIERDTVDELERTIVEFGAGVRLMGLQFPVRGRLYFIAPGDRLYVISYLADEGTFASQQSIFDAIVHSFELDQ